MRLGKKFHAGCLLLLLAGYAGNALSAERISAIEIRGNIAVVSDYVFRGITLSDENPVIQGGVELILPRDFYAGAWVSGVDKPWGAVYNQIPGREDIEYDVYAGWRWESNSGNFLLDTGVRRYGFSSDPDDIAWTDAYMSALLFNKLRVKVSTDVEGLEFGTYYEARFRQPINDAIDATFHVGHFDVEDRLVRELEKYTDFSFGVGGIYRGFRVDLTYHRTDRDGRARYLDYADDRVTLAVRRNFELFPNFRMFEF
ncbi:MAG: TorF family putative porin [Arenicella sp.]|nr:TorF family putative porin [Arenicella sp.]